MKKNWLVSLSLFALIAITACKKDSENVNTGNNSDGLVLLYSFSGNALDSSGHSNHGTVTGAKLTPDRNNAANKAYSFGGTDFITVKKNDMDLTVHKAFTIVATVKASITDPVAYTIFSCDDAWNKFAFSFSISNTSMIVALHNNNNSSVWHKNSVSFSPGGVYRQIAWVQDSVNMYLYQDGSLIKKDEWTSGVWNKNTTANAYVGLFRSSYDNSNNEYFKGIIDELRVYDRALSNSEIAALYSHL